MALIWLSIGMDLPKWWPTERPNFLLFCSSCTSFFIKNPAWKFRSKRLLGAKYSGISSQIFSRRFFHPSRIWTRASSGVCPMLYVSWGSKTWKPQKCRVPLSGRVPASQQLTVAKTCKGAFLCLSTLPGKSSWSILAICSPVLLLILIPSSCRWPPHMLFLPALGDYPKGPVTAKKKRDSDFSFISWTK